MPLLATYRILHGLSTRPRLRFAGGRGLLPQLHRGLRAGHRLLPCRAVPRDGLDHHDALPLPPRPGGPRARAPATRSTSSPPTARTWSSTSTPAPPTRSPPRDAAQYLRASGVAKIQGFFLNATHFDWTSREIRYGSQISRLTGGKHFVINTGENGRGPLRPRTSSTPGNEVLCNPPGRGLGPLPTANTGYRERRHVRLDQQPGRVRRRAASRARRRPASTGPPTR